MTYAKRRIQICACVRPRRRAMASTPQPGLDAEAAPPSVEAVREATRAVLPLVDLETVKEREVVAMVEQRLGAMVADAEPLRAAVQDEIDRCLLQDDELLMATRAPAPPAGVAAGAAAGAAAAPSVGSGGEPKRKGKPKRKRAGGLDGFVVDDDEDDEDYLGEDDDEDDEDDDGPRATKNTQKTQRPNAVAARRYTKAEWRDARHDWSAPAPTPRADANEPFAPNTETPTGGARAPGAPPIAKVTDDKILSALASVCERDGAPGATAKALASVLTIPKSEVNKALYRLERAGEAKKSADPAGGAPAWTPVHPARANEGANGRTSVATFGGPSESKKETEGPNPAVQNSAARVDGEVCALSETRRVSVGEYRGAKHVSLREFYCKNGIWLPGKKGINLSVEQWVGLKAAAAAVTARLRSNETGDVVVAELGKHRRVTVGFFRGAATVGVREFYEKNGEMFPGFRGLNMSKEQWDVLVAHVEAVDEALRRAS